MNGCDVHHQMPNYLKMSIQFYFTIKLRKFCFPSNGFITMHCWGFTNKQTNSFSLVVDYFSVTITIRKNGLFIVNVQSFTLFFLKLSNGVSKVIGRQFFIKKLLSKS